MKKESECRFLGLRNAFSSSGGMVGGEDLCGLLRRRWLQPISVVARWIVSRQVVSVEAEGQTWLPLFQFNLEALDVTPDALLVIHELRGVLDDQELIDWFAAPNSWLDGALPADALSGSSEVVREAARELLRGRWKE